MIDYRQSIEVRNDWYTARVVAAVVAANSRDRRMRPNRYMLQEHLRHQARREEDKPVLTGDEVFAAFQRMGHPMIEVTVQ